MVASVWMVKICAWHDKNKKIFAAFFHENRVNIRQFERESESPPNCQILAWGK